MKTLFIIILGLISTVCNGQDALPKDIIDKTKQFPKDSLFWVSLSQKEYCGDYLKLDSNIYCGSLKCYTPEMNVEIESFQILYPTPYSKDNKNVYYYYDYMCDDCDDCCGGCSCDIFIVEDANPISFKIVEGHYATDEKNIYLYGTKINNAGVKSFRVIVSTNSTYIAVDKNNVYLWNNVFEKADASTFYYDKNDKRNNTNASKSDDIKYIIGDENNKWEYYPLRDGDRISKIENE